MSEGIDNQVHTYYDTLKSLYKDQHDVEHTQKRELADQHIKRDRRTRMVCDINCMK